MAGLCEGSSEPPGSLKTICKKNDAETDQKEKKEMAGSLSEKKLSNEECTRRNGERRRLRGRRRYPMIDDIKRVKVTRSETAVTEMKQPGATNRPATGQRGSSGSKFACFSGVALWRGFDSCLTDYMRLNDMKVINAGEMNPGSSTESYAAFARIALRENPGKNLNQVTCPDRDSNLGHLVSQPDALTFTPQVWTGVQIMIGATDRIHIPFLLRQIPPRPPCRSEAKLLPRVGPPRVPLQKPSNIAELHSTEACRESQQLREAAGRVI
ncbi:hypothetical protein ANN_04280 [Periplaneta americana]|uniref:Uncharacterized protein n=1 Tax=Periplaneta americana TaxID=6978 RepID=A0ABQ8T850_PERAM|nr:hypothetical protein ANN_04280 [Periplaneta americana]